MRPASSRLSAALSLVAIASLTLMSGAGTDTSSQSPAPSPAPSSDLSVRAGSGLYVRSTPGNVTIAGRRVIARAFLYNNLMPVVASGQPNLGTLIVTLEPNDPRGLPPGINANTRVTAEIVQGRARWRGVLPPYANPLADSSDLLVPFPTFSASGVRTFPTGSKVTINLTVRVGGRDHRVTLRNVEVNAVY
jgi:hypothetical protein